MLETLAGRGPDACIDSVGMEAHGHGLQFAYDRAKQMAKIEMDRPIAVREAIMACRSAGIVSIRTGQCHVHRYLKPLLDRIERGDIDPTFVVSHRMQLDEVAKGYSMFNDKQDEVMKIVLKAN